MNVEEQVRRLLDSKGIKYKVIEHAPVYKSLEAAKVRGVELKTGVKALLLKTHEGRFIMALVRGDRKADLKRIAELEKTRKVYFATAEEVIEHAGAEVGAVSPFGHPKTLKTYMDKHIFENELVNFNIGLHTKSITMRAQDLKRILPEAIMI